MPTWPNRSSEYYLDALHHSDARARRQAAAALGVLAERRAIEPLIELLARDISPDVRANAARTLGRLDDVRAIEPLRTAANHDVSASVRGTAIRVLEKMKDAHALEVYLAALRDPDWGVRYWAVRALGTLGDARAVEPLMELLMTANETLAPVLALALGQIGAPALRPLLAALRHENRTVRAWAATALGSFSDVRVVEPLRHALLHDDEELVRARAKQSLAMHQYAVMRERTRQHEGEEPDEGERHGDI